MEFCEPEISDMLKCYGNGTDAVMECADCVYSGLLSEDEDVDCNELEQGVIIDYEACGNVCESTCDASTTQLISCGAPMFCSGALALKIE